MNQVRFSIKSFVFGLGVISLFLSGVWASQIARAAVSREKEKPISLTESVPANDGYVPGRPGPWGNLEYHAFYLEAPDSLLTNVQKPNSVPRWAFAGADENSLRALFNRAGLPVDFQKRLFDPQRILVQDGAVILFPQVSDIEAMTAAMRETIYPELAKSPINEFHRDPVFITGTLDDWLRDSHLSDEMQGLIRKGVYRCGKGLAFSDIRMLLSHAHSEGEVQHIMKTTTRIRSLFVRLKIPHGTDPKELAAYWTAGRPDSDILPLLESACESSESTVLDIRHLLPPIPRRRIYTFPAMDLAVRGRMPDCHWSSLNFFNFTTQDYFLDTRLASERVNDRYVQVAPPYKFGDALFFLNGEGSAIHSCVYIADDVVFTKNGENSLKPWMFMQMGDVQSLYQRSPEWRVQGYRLKPEGS